MRGIGKKCPIAMITTEVIGKDGSMKTPVKEKLLTPFEGAFMGADQLYVREFELEPEDLAFELQLVDSNCSEAEDEFIVLRRPVRYTREMLEELDDYLFWLGWPYPYPNKL